MKKNLDIRSDVEKIKTLFLMMIIFAVILPFGLCALKWILPNIPTQNLFEMLFTMITCLCVYIISKIDNFEEIEFEGDFSNLSLILHKQLRLRISEKKDDLYIFKSQNYLLPNASYIVMDLGDHCKIIARVHMEIQKVFNQIKLAQQGCEKKLKKQSYSSIDQSEG